MKKITQAEYNEYELLKVWAKKQAVYQSANSITDLVDDIDLPIRRCVAMVALLGCEPIFSCCGFDYEGQPYHKSHQYRQPYIKVQSNIQSTKLYLNTNVELARWGWSFRPMQTELILELLLPMNPHWNDTNCIHASEECVIAIAKLEHILMKLHTDFSESATIYDTNASRKRVLRFWQYPSKRSWTVYKSDLMNY